ncbi:hypothetical protein F9L16_03165 [Agarivorans sp. B2Z047]|uniref:hypothetical protein n=1 Tax=Agarivorans sp. B2Z047 TaxID=2652721 RepID=UPI00128D306E|nr:hypothetical protein [Agarivorans sp. B2Z047]MPW27995.1 hypothetical protein [Agarivorans sp. B2Z047]UQN44174.1 hypothetical protein LQZ07_06785 [Agarivorans sp. B2Z047]
MTSKYLVLFVSLSLFSLNSFSETIDKEIDPSDLTRVYTQAALMVSGNSNVMPVGMISGGYNNAHQFALLAEAKFGKSGENAGNEFGLEYGSSRFQYFQVADTGSSFMPRAGLSADYINVRSSSIKSDLLALGGVAAINQQFTPGFMLFPMAGYVFGNMEINGIKEDVNGVNLSIAASIPIGGNGAFMMIWPEYRKVSGNSIKTENVSTKLILNSPLTNDRKWWINTRIELDNSQLKLGEDSLVKQRNSDVYMGIRYFF